MTLLDTLYGQPLPIDPRFVKRVEPLGPYEFSDEEARKIGKAAAHARYREKHRELVNARVRNWRERQRGQRA